MTKKQYLARMKKHEQKFDALWSKIVADTNDYLKTEPKNDTSQDNRINKFVDSLCLSGAWVQDRLNGYEYHNRKLTKKIRRALGYTYP